MLLHNKINHMFIQYTVSSKPIVNLDSSVKPIVQKSSGYEIPDIDSLNHDINMDFEGNSQHQESIIDDINQRPKKLSFEEPPGLRS